MSAHPPYLNAGNAGPFTLDGTRTFKIGTREVALLDPGPDVEDHVRALRSWVADASAVRVVLTHGHPDHAGGARRLADALGAPVLGPEGVPEVDTPIADGESVPTDAGPLVAVDTPGHARAHFCYLRPAEDALFVGDLLLGKGDTTWVAEYPGCVADYLASLRRVRELAPSVLYPAHGPPIEDVTEALDRYERHRMDRIAQVEAVLREEPDATLDRIMERVYGPLPSAVEGAARMSLGALLEYVRS